MRPQFTEQSKRKLYGRIKPRTQQSYFDDFVMQNF